MIQLHFTARFKYGHLMYYPENREAILLVSKLLERKIARQQHIDALKEIGGVELKIDYELGDIKFKDPQINFH